MSEENKYILQVKDLHTSFATDAGEVRAVNGVSFNLEPGKTLGIVGESGSGKSVTSYSIMQILAETGKITGGEVLYHGEDISKWNEKQMQKFRGEKCSIIFQDPMTSLNPVFTIGNQLMEAILLHTDKDKKQARERAIEMLTLVGVNEPESRLKQYPHELSGGMRQRVMIAMALVCEPDILIADEPTTALDVTIQAQILELMQDLQKKLGMAIIMVTHDLGVIASMCDEIIVMYGGRVCERGTADAIFYHPAHEYTKGLLRSIPKADNMNEKLIPIGGTPINLLQMPEGCAFCPRCESAMKICLKQQPAEFRVGEDHLASCWMNVKKSMKHRRAAAMSSEKKNNDYLLEVEHLKQYFPVHQGFSTTPLKAVDDISFAIRPGETLGLVGESGCGKTTVGRTLLRLYQPTAGKITFDGKVLFDSGEQYGENGKMIVDANGKPVMGKKVDVNMMPYRKEMQMVFQDPYSSLNPRMTVEDIIGEPLDVHKLYRNRKERREKILDLMELVGLNAEHAMRYAHEFSGGQRQRIGIARALAVNPKFIVCDEAVSALDVSIQAQVVNMFEELQEKLGVAYLFIAHDLLVVHHISDRIAVMYLGKMMEIADADELNANPIHPYTLSLLSAVPIPDPETARKSHRIVLEGDVPSPLKMPTGCPFRTRCKYATEKCGQEMPQLTDRGNGHMVACWNK